METVTTKTIEDLTITVKIIRKTVNKTAYADGWNVDVGKENYENINITIDKDGKKAICGDINFFYVVDDRFDKIKTRCPQAHARFGDTYVSEKIYNLIKETLVEAETSCPGDIEFINIKTKKEALRTAALIEENKINAENQQRENHFGWCKKCQSYCYGDCQSN